jgi:hypothetical protein
MKELNFYQQPFRLAKYGTWVYDKNSNFVFQFQRKYDDKGGYIPSAMHLEQSVLYSLNSKDHRPIFELSLSIDADDLGLIRNNGEEFILIRGWGNLTGIGAHNFSAEKAAKIQDDFKDWIIYKLQS